MKRYIFNSSKKIVGEISFSPNKINIHHYKKPLLEITDISIINKIYQGEDEQTLQKLYDDYTLLVSEVACLYNISYTRANKWFKSLPLKTTAKAGRRNSSYGKIFSKQRIQKIVNGRKDDRKQRKGCSISKEQCLKISQTLKKKHKNGEIKINRDKIREAWKQGRYENVDFGHGIGGYITSKKIKKRFFFRSLLELKYILLLEKNNAIFYYKYEKLKIPCNDGSYYTPDFIINNINVIELKSKKYIFSNETIYKRFIYKKQQAEEYCNNNNLNYKVVFDEDIGFESKKMKRFLVNNPELIKEYQITFINPERVFGHEATEWLKTGQ